MIDLSDIAMHRRTRDLVDPGLPEEVRAALDARMIWSAITEPGDGVAGALIAGVGPRRGLELLGDSERDAALADRIGIDAAALAAARARWRPRLAEAERPAEAARRASVGVLAPELAGWPSRVDDLGVHAPICLWVRGHSSALSDEVPAVAFVGARAATSYGEYVVGDLAGSLAASGATIVSGGAYGIDGMAHRAALSTGGGTTAWLAGGVDRPYPAGHRGLLEQIVAAGGALVAEVPCGSAPTKWRFLARNRLIAAASDATVVVEAGWRSGSLNTAGHASALGRSLGAVPGPVTSAASAGCHRLLREYGAQCITGVDDVRELLGWDVVSAPAETRRVDDRSRLRDALSTRAARTAADLARRSGLSQPDAESVLGLLALEGAVIRTPDGWRAAPR